MDTPLTYADSIVIARSPVDLYDMVSDVTRMGAGIPQTLAALKRIAEETLRPAVVGGPARAGDRRWPGGPGSRARAQRQA